MFESKEFFSPQGELKKYFSEEKKKTVMLGLFGQSCNAFHLLVGGSSVSDRLCDSNIYLFVSPDQSCAEMGVFTPVVVHRCQNENQLFCHWSERGGGGGAYSHHGLEVTTGLKIKTRPDQSHLYTFSTNKYKDTWDANSPEASFLYFRPC